VEKKALGGELGNLDLSDIFSDLEKLIILLASTRFNLLPTLETLATGDRYYRVIQDSKNTYPS
jgi:hypothetical protein